MNSDTIKTFSYRISQANRTQLVVVTFDIAVQYITDALASGNVSEYRENLRMTKRVIDELVSSLNMSFDISRQLFDTYMVIERYIIKAGSNATSDDYLDESRVKLLNSCRNMLGKLRDAFSEVAKQDDSAPLMQNSQTVYAGLTYSRGGGASETYDAGGSNRGFRA